MIVGKGHDERTRRVIELLEQKYPGALFVDFEGKHARVDTMAISPSKKKVIALFEIKCRTATPDQFPNYLINAEKIETMLRLSDHLQTEAILVVCYADGSVFAWQIGIGGWEGAEGPIERFKGKRVMLLPNSERKLLGYLEEAA